MTISLYNNYSDKRVLGKNLSLIKTVTGNLKNDCSIISPIIDIKYDENLFSCNYLYIQEFNRYYFINDIIVKSGEVLTLTCKVDVLESSKNEIDTMQVRVIRNEHVGLTFIRDNNITLSSEKEIKIAKFSESPINIEDMDNNTMNFVINLAGK